MRDLIAYQLSLKDPDHFVQSGGKFPISILVTGDQLAGKSSCLKTVARETNRQLIIVNGSEEVLKFKSSWPPNVCDQFLTWLLCH